MTQKATFNTPRNSPVVEFYQNSMQALLNARVDFVVGGAYALRHHTGIARDTKDLDLFVRPGEWQAALKALEEAGYRTELVNTAWLAKAYSNDAFIDVIFRTGNGVAEVDDLWFERAQRMQLFRVDVPVSPAEEVIWSKAFTMERERFDLADIVHIIQAKGSEMDWQHLLKRFAAHWRILYSHVILFGYVFPGEKHAVPNWIMEELAERMRLDHAKDYDSEQKICQGTLLSTTQYLVDILCRGYKDARFYEPSSMTDEELGQWKATLDRELSQRLKDAALILPTETRSAASS